MVTNGKFALVTGANKGLGFETAKKLAKLGFFVFLGIRNKLRGEEAIEKLKALNITNVESVEIDVTNIHSIVSAKELLTSKVTHLDVLVNNAGILGEMPQSALSVSVDNVKSVLETNFYGVIQTTQQFIDLLKKSEQPRIVNVTSDLGSLTNHSNPNWEHYKFKLTAYVASKAALNAYTIMLAHELGDSKFKVNSVNPGYTATDFNHHNGTRTVEFASEIIVKYAIIDENGPTGKFFSEDGETSW